MLRKSKQSWLKYVLIGLMLSTVVDPHLTDSQRGVIRKILPTSRILLIKSSILMSPQSKHLKRLSWQLL